MMDFSSGCSIITSEIGAQVDITMAYLDTNLN